MRILIVVSGNSGKVSPFVQDQVTSLETMGLSFDYFLIKGKGLLGYLKNYPRLIHTIKKKKYDLLHAHYGLSGLLASAQFKLPVLITFHGSDINLKKNYFFSRLAANISTENIFVHSNLSKRLKYNQKRINIIPCGVDLETFRPIPQLTAKKILGLDINIRYILFSSAFNNPVKNSLLARDATNGLNDTKLIELKNYSKKEVNLLMNASDLLLITSFSETGPIVAKEALACNCPIVSTNVGDVKMIINNVKNCFITEFDAHDIQNKIRFIFDSNYRSNGRENVKPFSLDKIAKKIFEVYKTLNQST